MTASPGMNAEFLSESEIYNKIADPTRDSISMPYPAAPQNLNTLIPVIFQLNKINFYPNIYPI